MTEIQKSKKFDLEDRTREYAKAVRVFVKDLSRNLLNQSDLNQLLRSSGSVGANYIEANEALSKKDFVHRIKICRKEAKESCYWLNLLEITANQNEPGRNNLIKESMELTKIFSAIVTKSS